VLCEQDFLNKGKKVVADERDCSPLNRWEALSKNGPGTFERCRHGIAAELPYTYKYKLLRAVLSNSQFAFADSEPGA
jgi:hypothetical protein